MHRIHPGRFLKVLLDFYRESGGPVEYVLLEYNGPGGATEETHHEAGVMALNLLHQDAKREFPDIGFRLSMRPAEARLWPIDHDAFLGSTERRGFVGEKDHRNPGGYFAAFTGGPHGPALPQRETEGLFRAINEQLFGESSRLSIFRWSTDWSNYYDAGHDWGEAYHWTVDVPGERRLVSLSISTTD